MSLKKSELPIAFEPQRAAHSALHSMNDVLPIGHCQRELTLYDPKQGLKSIAVAEAAEKHFRRAKDASKLYKAIEEKIRAQAEYVVWRDSVVVPSQNLPGAGKGKGKRVAVPGPSKLPEADPGKRVVERWRKKLCDTKGKVDAAKVAAEAERISKRVATIIDNKKLAVALRDAKHRVVRICEQEKDGTVRGTENTGEFERYTPAYYIEAARLVLGEIDLDPASSEIAQRTVKAAQYFTAKSEPDGLKRDWHGRVFLNPPYHRELMPLFIEKLITEFEAGRISAAIVLTNNCTDTEWFLAAEAACNAICFTNGRIKFTQGDGVMEVLPTQGQAFFYFGPDVAAFDETFETIGFVVVPVGSCLNGGAR
jgi:DNA N-6-adenine-methyltransferase (Dam)